MVWVSLTCQFNTCRQRARSCRARNRSAATPGEVGQAAGTTPTSYRLLPKCLPGSVDHGRTGPSGSPAEQCGHREVPSLSKESAVHTSRPRAALAVTAVLGGALVVGAPSAASA